MRKVSPRLAVHENSSCPVNVCDTTVGQGRNVAVRRRERVVHEIRDLPKPAYRNTKGSGTPNTLDYSVPMNSLRSRLTAVVACLFLAACATTRTTTTAAGKPSEGRLEPFVGAAAFDLRAGFPRDRHPNVVVSVDGTVLLVFGGSSVQVRRSEDGGETFGPAILIAKGIMGGGVTVDETTGEILAFVEASHPPAPLTIYRSSDDGKSWQAQVDAVVQKDVRGNVPSMHMNEHGITLRHGPHAGRLLRAARSYGKGNAPAEYSTHYTTAIYSDDGGSVWHPSAPFPEQGTGEATLAELSDGTIYYNSRVHWQEREQYTRRRCAWSHDGGATWVDWQVVPVLPDGRQDRPYGCMGGLTRLPIAGRDILVFSNIDTSRAARERITVWGSFDGGKTWPVKRLVLDGPSAYSSLTAGRPETVSEGFVYLHFETNPGSHVARFNLTWLLAGERTGDGAVPAWVTE